ncbi:YxiG family protein [Fictibacillus barbaricus]|uniref:Uncharacterized DUF497 family protein n=1 Tax=Fictibacillus barbaricus TaxID=182136 RepID=A0ABU1U198_9BACL|nr:hypothetical protein [Fictibacillus barbaricus]MDR7073212.1 uncharacterized DUF497 family protein [Fictibacillus barbaricus]
MNTLKEYLNDLWANVIDDMKIDVVSHSILFKTKAIDGEKITKYIVGFEEVSSFYFLEDSGENRYNLIGRDQDNYLELTSIEFHPKGIGIISIDSKSENWVKQYVSNSNFSIEIWNSMLFIEAKRIVINEKTFDVGYPQLN